MKKILLALLLVCILAIGVLLASYFTGYEIYRDVGYADGEEQKMDIFIPKAAYGRDTNGCVLFIHGGSWSGGDKSEEALRCRLLASQGYIAATLNYTLWSEENASEYSVMQALDDIDAALTELKTFALAKGIVIDKVATSGYSAGAHLSMLYSYSRGEGAPMEILFTSNMAGPADISARVWGNDMAKRVGKRLTGVDISDEDLESEQIKALLESVSPTSYVNADTPPSIIMHGGKDDVVPIANAESLIDKFTEYSVDYDYVYLKNSDHTLIQNPLKHITYYRLLLSYCEEYFGAN